MAQPGLQHYDEDDEQPVIGPNLRALEGGGETTPRASGHLSSVGGNGGKTVDAKAGEAAAISGPGTSAAAVEEKGAVGSKGEGSLFNADANDEGFLSRARSSFMGRHRKKFAVGAGVAGVGVTGVIAILSISSGPLEFIHMAKLLTQFHFSANEDQSDVRVGRLIRYLGDRKAENVRMGRLGNKYADLFEAKLNNIGLKSQYTKAFGFKDGLAVDKNNEKFKGQSNEQIRETLINEYGVPPDSIKTEGGLHIDNAKMGYRDTLRLNRGVLKAAGYSKINAWIGARTLGARAGITWHPIRKLDQKALGAVDAKLKAWRETRAQEIGTGTDPVAAPGSPVDNEGKPTSQAGSDAATEIATEIAEEASKAAGDASSGDPGAFESFRTSLGVKAGAGAAGVVGLGCMAKSLADNVDQIKQKEVILPLMRIGMTAIATGGQVMYGASDVDPDQLGYMHKLMYGKDSSGKVTIWSDAASIKAALGQVGGIEPSETLKSIGKGTPFDFLKQGEIGSALGAACSTTGQVVMIGFGLLTGPVTTIVQGAIAEAFLPKVLDAAAHWFSGQAVDAFAAGADYGSNADFGAYLGANDQSIGSGGAALTKTESTAIQSTSGELNSEDFANQSFATRIFSPDDPRSLFSQVLDRQNPNIDQNISNVASATLNVSRTFTGIFSSLLSGVKAHATAVPYDYGIPTYGFSEEEVQDPSVTNPYANAEKAAALLTTDPDAEAYKAKVTECFGVNIINDSDGNLAVDAKTKSVEAYNSTYDSAGCRDSGNSKWLSIRSFIADSETMDSMSCYEGDEESCNLIGATSATSAAEDGTNSGLKTGTLCTIKDKRVNEASGLAASIKHPGIVYTENDEGSTVYAIDSATCEVKGTFNVKGLRSGDFPDGEAIQIDHATGKMWFGDIGNGHPGQPFSDKDQSLKNPGAPAKIAVFDEPETFGGQSVTAQTYDITYQGGMQNSEALLANPVSGKPDYIINKAEKSTVYSLPRAADGSLKSGSATKVPGVTINGWATDASFTNDGKWILVRYRTLKDAAPTNVYVYDSSWNLKGNISVPKVEQGESITVEESNKSFLIGSEGNNSPLVRVALPVEFGGDPPTTGTNGGGKLDLGPWKLTLPIGKGGDPMEIIGKDLSQYSNPPWYKKADDGSGQEFYVDSKKATATTSTSDNPRSELREMTAGGKNEASWSSNSGVHQLLTKLKVTTLSGKDGNGKKFGVVISQIHDSEDDVSVFRLEGKMLWVTSADDTHAHLVDGNVALNQVITVGFKVQGNKIQYYYSPTGATSPPLISYSQSKSFSGSYFKAGNYCQCSSEGGRYGQTRVVIMGLGVTHNGTIPNIGGSSSKSVLPI